MNPYLVETFVKTTGSHQNVTDDFGNTDGFISTVLTPVNTTLKHVKAKFSSKEIKQLINHDNINDISDKALTKKLVNLSFYLKRKNRKLNDHPEYVDWANTNSVTLRNDKGYEEWWKKLNYESRLACYHFVNSKDFKPDPDHFMM